VVAAPACKWRAIEVYAWGRPFGFIRNPLEYKRNRSDAERIARKVAYYDAAAGND